MTLSKWCEILAGLRDPGETRDCLLMMADEMPEREADEIRTLAKADTSPYQMPGQCCWSKYSWWVGCDQNVNKPCRSSSLPDEIYDALDDFTWESHDFKFYYVTSDAWRSLFAAVKGLCDEVSPSTLPT